MYGYPGHDPARSARAPLYAPQQHAATRHSGPAATTWC